MAEVKRCALYLRVSSDEQSVDMQRPDLLRLAESRSLVVIETYEETESAAKKRPVFRRMLADAQAKRFDVLLVWALDRFGRSMAGNMADAMALSDAGVALASLALTYHQKGPAYVASEAYGMIFGALALYVYGVACVVTTKQTKLPVWLTASASWLASLPVEPEAWARDVGVLWFRWPSGAWARCSLSAREWPDVVERVFEGVLRATERGR